MAPRATRRTAAHRHPAEPGDAGADAVAAEAAAHGDEPAERLGDRDRQRRGPGAGRQRHAAVLAPAQRRAADGLEAVGQARRAAAGSVPGPAAHTTTSLADHDAWRRTSPAGSGATSTASAASAAPGQPVVGRPRGGRARPRSRRPPGRARGRTARRTASRLSSVSSSSRSRARRQAGGVGLEQGQLLGCGDAVDRRPGGRLHRSCGLVHVDGAPPRRTPAVRETPGGNVQLWRRGTHRGGRSTALGGTPDVSSIEPIGGGATDPGRSPSRTGRSSEAPKPVRYDEPSRTGV